MSKNIAITRGRARAGALYIGVMLSTISPQKKLCNCGKIILDKNKNLAYICNKQTVTNKRPKEPVGSENKHDRRTN